MAKQRIINTRFWVDPWIQEELNSLDRLLFLYLLTNDQTNLSGIYEISNFKMCFELGIEKETLLRAMFPRLQPKVYREGNWIIMINFPKHQNTNNPSIVQGIQRELELIPQEIYEKAIEYGYPVPKEGGRRGVEGTPNLTKPNLSDTEKPTYSSEEEWVTEAEPDENGRPVKEKKKVPMPHEWVHIWNRFPNWKSTGKNGKPPNPSVLNQLLPVARQTRDLTAAIIRKRGKYSTEEFEFAVRQYAMEICNRTKDKSSFYLHRFPLYEFLTHKGIFEKYVNR